MMYLISTTRQCHETLSRYLFDACLIKSREAEIYTLSLLMKAVASGELQRGDQIYIRVSITGQLPIADL